MNFFNDPPTPTTIVAKPRLAKSSSLSPKLIQVRSRIAFAGQNGTPCTHKTTGIMVTRYIMGTLCTFMAAGDLSLIESFYARLTCPNASTVSTRRLAIFHVFCECVCVKRFSLNSKFILLLCQFQFVVSLSVRTYCRRSRKMWWSILECIFRFVV